MSLPDPTLNAGRAGDGCQHPLVPRSRCPPRLTPGVGLLSTFIFASDAGYGGLCYHWPWVIQEVVTRSHRRRP